MRRSLAALLIVTPTPSAAAAAQDWLYAPREYAANPDGAFVAHGDVDGDGDPDLVQVDADLGSYARGFRPHLNDGAGELTAGALVALDAAKTYPIYTMLPQCADFDGDGDLDLVLAVSAGPSGPGFELHPGHGDGTFGAPVYQAVEGGSAEAAVGDFDGDGAVELALANRESTVPGAPFLVRWWSWNGAGFSPSSALTGLAIESLAAFDRDGDGFPELAVGHSDAASLTIVDSLIGQPVATGTLALPLASPGGMKVYAADFEGDGFEDLLVAVWTALAPGSFDAKMQLVGVANAGGTLLPGAVSELPDFPYDYTVDPLWIADWDADGDPDVVAHSGGFADPSQAGFVILANDGAERFASAATVLTKDLGAGAGALDLNGDGHVDFVAPRSVLLGDGTLRSFPTPFPWGGALSPGIAVDWEGDGDVDYLTAVGSLVRNDGAGGYGTAADVAALLPPKTATYSTGAAVAMGDLDGDGAADMVVPEWFQPVFGTFELVGMKLFRSDGLGGLASVGFAAPAGTSIDAILINAPNPMADLDGDGDLDVLAQDGYRANDGSGFFAAFTPAYAGYPIAAADADLDGDVDVLTATTSGFTQIALQRQLAGFGFQSEVLGTTAAWFGRTGRFADVEGDGLVDVLVGLPPTGKLKLYGNTGAGYVEQELEGSQYGVDHIDVLDVDGDGLTDVVAGPYLTVYPETRISVHRRTSPTAAAFEPVRFFTGTAVRATFDADADGDVDLFGAGPILSRVKHGADNGLIRQYGAGSVGTGGAVPVLGASGPPVAGSLTYALHLRLAVGGAPALLGLGFHETALVDTPFPGMTLYVGGLLPLIPFATSGPSGGAGMGELDAPFFPTPALAGLAFFHQIAILDPAAASGVCATNGLEVRFAP